MPRFLALALLVLLTACGSAEVVTPPTPVATAVAVATPTTPPAERWSEHLSGTWLDEDGTAWTLDLDQGTITFITAGGIRSGDSPIRISVESEDGREVSVRFTGRPTGDSVDTFRFLDRNTLAWGERMLRRR
jgi:hypothetical protein